MRELFSMDLKDYDPNGTRFVRNSARAILLRGGKVAMVHSLKYDYYKFPGGGIETGESAQAALIREVAEEAGLVVIPGSMREYGCVHRAQKSNSGREEIFVQDNFYYLCAAEERVLEQRLDAYEQDESFTLEWVSPHVAIAANRVEREWPFAREMVEREARVLECLLAEGHLE